MVDGLAKRGRMQASFLETFTDCPSFVFCKYVRDFLCIGISRECSLVPIIGHLSQVSLGQI